MLATDRRQREVADLLYDRYARPLEAEYRGKFVAVTERGETIVGDTVLDVAKRAVAAFGPGAFIFKIGEQSVGRWR
jgi:hypothetical protein